MRKVMIATPAHDGRVCVHFADSLAESIKLAAKHDIDLCAVYWPGEALVQHARNMLAKLALEGGVSDVIFIDGDQGWNPEWIVKLLSYPVDVVGGAVVKKSDNESYNVKMRSMVIDQTTGLMIVDALGTGFLRVSRAALSNAWSGSAEYRAQGQATRMLFAPFIDTNSGEMVGEDIGFCETLTACGYRIHLDPSMTCTHIGQKVYQGDFARFIKTVKFDSAQNAA